MIVCPNCNHQNPDGAVQCEACYTPLPAMVACSNCGAAVQTDASFCGQCGFNLRPGEALPTAISNAPPLPDLGTGLPDLVPPDPLIMPEPLMSEPVLPPVPPIPNVEAEPPIPSVEAEPAAAIAQPPAAGLVVEPPANLAAPRKVETKTQLQQQSVRLLHVQTNVTIELPQGLTIIHLGKPNDRIPPDVDVSGFPDSEIVSRIHADIRMEGDAYYLEDVGSSNGTYVNNVPLPMGNRHRLRPGDRISLGKGDKMSFIFQLS